ncbi:TIM-barrel domain-containing protein [Bifidobacterium castoris]|uniref:Alpha-glucosidase n=1 Tax=Bifidobacterium castoris TaxID=2306972 RepID=A0A430F4Z7_9BIFI|nr:alpha-glucosidase [Bifidobacterium castoris]
MTYDAFRGFADTLHPMAPADQIVQGGHWRISVLTDSLIRLEWSADGEFEDRPTQTVLNRALGREIHARITRLDGGVRIDTPALRLEYDGKPFSKEGLSVIVKGVPGSQFNTWHYGDEPKGNLKGTAKTLDEADGAIPLGDGVLSRDGWAVLDDTDDNVIAERAQVNGVDNPFGTWPTARVRDADRRDLYFFGYGLRFTEAVEDFHRLTGPTPLIPRFALGNWWSRFYRYGQREYLDLMDRFAAEGIPFTVSVIDMDWHITDPDPKYGSGWTGYSWNTDLFPDRRGFLRELHGRGLHVTLNEHPRDGIRAFEDEYPQVARDMRIDPASGDPVEFDPSSPRFMDAYLTMMERLSRDGVDFWWVDWQQGGVTRQRGLDPLWMLNHSRYLDSGRDGHWPLTFSRYAGPGSHRYPIGFSGDTVMTWESLDFQPRFTATASNIGYGWWSHDIGGHMLGYRDDELEARWYQYGVFSPINRLHSSSSPFSGKEPWNFPEPVRSAMVRSLRLRQALIPYLYTMNHRAARDGRPLVEPMYWQHPQQDAAYWYPNEYRFGTELVAAPITRRNDPESRRGRADLWLPQGEWFDFFDGRRYTAGSGGRRLSVWRTIDATPVFAKAGAIIPMQEVGDGPALNTIANPRHMQVLAFPGDGTFTLIEDDGVWAHVRDGRCARTVISQQWDRRGMRLIVEPASGEAGCVPRLRDWTFTIRGVAPLKDPGKDVHASIGGVGHACVTGYDDHALSLSITAHDVPVDQTMELSVEGACVADSPFVEDCRRILLDAQMPNVGKDLAFDAIRRGGAGALASLHALDVQTGGAPSIVTSHVPQPVISALAEVLLRDAGSVD